MDPIAWLEGIDEDRVALVPDGVATASDRRLRRWGLDEIMAGSATRPLDDTVDRYPRPGPLQWLPAPEVLAWGPARADVPWAGDGGEAVQAAAGALGMDPLLTRLSAGAVSPDGTFSSLLLVQAQSRVKAERARPAHGPGVGLAVTAASTGSPVGLVELSRGSSLLAWHEVGILVGSRQGVLVVTPGVDELVTTTLPDSSGRLPAAAAGFGDRVVVALGDAVLEWADVRSPPQVTPWSHGRIRSLDVTETGHVVVGSDDGTLRVLEHGRPVAEQDLGAPVVGVSAAGRLIACKTGGLGGRLALFET